MVGGRPLPEVPHSGGREVFRRPARRLVRRIPPVGTAPSGQTHLALHAVAQVAVADPLRRHAELARAALLRTDLGEMRGADPIGGLGVVE